ncbi:hypothetical protein D9619_000891 [Psilocybe cf. subviscida]|uniref:Uncharacterized protein n=1 Tax=Psilocybe cf. subviscida TaxID=2480587 RepID=A0A8H5BFY1_9AGAR|nr:hypothetical protein D9619_000891 [Psilocybe cf. subviscida]
MNRSHLHQANTPPPQAAPPAHHRSQSHTYIPATPSASHSNHRSRRPSLSNTMHWLSRSSPTPNSTPTQAKIIKISEPQRVRGSDIISPRSGQLGSGAIVVRTPDEALRETGVRLSPELSDTPRPNVASESRTSLRKSIQSNPGTPHLSYIPSSEASASPPASPPLPPLPLSADTDEETLNEPESPRSSRGSKSPPRPSRTPPPAPSVPLPPVPSLNARNSRSSLKVRTVSTAIEDLPPSVPPLPPHIVASNQPPPFHVILVSDPPPVGVDPAKVMVTIETCTASHKTTLSTLQSRPSHLSKYLASIVSGTRGQHAQSMVSSIYSTESDDLHMYHHHLTSQGLVPSSCNIHLFLDRNSQPYSHILNFFRSPVIDGQPDTLPRSLQLYGSASSSSQSRLENLIEVREEAAFLGLESLHKLTTDEIRLRYGPRLHTRGPSNSSRVSVQSQQASVYSQYNAHHHQHADVPPSPICDSFGNPVRLNPPPRAHDSSPDLLETIPSSASINGHQSLKSPPAGWI